MLRALPVMLLSLVLVACQAGQGPATQSAVMGEPHAHHHMMMMASDAVAVIHGAGDNKVTGVVRFTQSGDDSVRVVADLAGLPPGSTHGFHIHEFGD